jgi:hypothetical protein
MGTGSGVAFVQIVRLPRLAMVVPTICCRVFGFFELET